jgi:hypothetical protein
MKLQFCMFFLSFTDDVILVSSFIKPFNILFASPLWSSFYHLPCRVIIPWFFFLTDKKYFWKDKMAKVYTVWLTRKVQYFGRWQYQLFWEKSFPWTCVWFWMVTVIELFESTNTKALWMLMNYVLLI